MDLYRKAKFYSISKFTMVALSLLAGASKENLIRLTHLAEKIPKKEAYREKIRWIRTLFQTDHPALTIARRVLKEIHPLHRKKIVTNFIINQLLVGTNRRKAFEEERGFKPPNAMLISPTMRCNLNCFGCYSGSYSTEEELPFEVIDRLVGECKEMGIYLVIITGGEPFLRKDLFDLFEKHQDTIFQVYTNGTLIDEKMVERFVALGNVVPAISIEGLREETDARRGKGHFDRVVQIMDWLKKAGIFFAISTTQTIRNSETIGSDAFIDFLVEKGCIFLWNFHYIPIGRDADLNLMATPEQRPGYGNGLPISGRRSLSSWWTSGMTGASPKDALPEGENTSMSMPVAIWSPASFAILPMTTSRRNLLWRPLTLLFSGRCAPDSPFRKTFSSTVP